MFLLWAGSLAGKEHTLRLCPWLLTMLLACAPEQQWLPFAGLWLVEAKWGRRLRKVMWSSPQLFAARCLASVRNSGHSWVV